MTGPIYLTEDIRRIEKAAGEVAPPLMERAGAAAAELAIEIVSEKSKDILVLAGPGNNGGDARIVFRILKEKFFRAVLATRFDEIPVDKAWGLVVDGLFGIGLARPIDGHHAGLVNYAHRQARPAVARD